MVDSFSNNTIGDFNIIEYAKKIINEIDQLRSFDSLTTLEDGITGTYQVPVESRLNAFFRMIGLPMFITLSDKSDKSGRSYTTAMSPGYIGSKLDGFSIKQAESVGDVDVSLLTGIRESKLLEMENKIGSKEFNKKMSTALLNPLDIYPDFPNKNFAFQGHVVPDTGDADLQRTVFKMLTPLITTYFDVRPVSRSIARPFAPKEDRQINNTTELKRPFIEEVVKIRLISGASAGSENYAQKANDLLDGFNGQINEDDLDQIEKDFNTLAANGLLENFIIEKFATSLVQIAKAWVRLEQELEQKLNDDVFSINIQTQSSRLSPFGKRMDVSTDIKIREDSRLGRKLAKINEQLIKEEVILTLLPFDSDEGLSNKSVSAFAIIEQFVDIIEANANELRKEKERIQNLIKKSSNEMDRIRLSLDLMNGEFSGISIPDIISVIMGLFLIPLEDLIYLMDIGVIEEIRKNDSLSSALDALNISADSEDPESHAERSMEAVIKLENAIYLVFSLIHTNIKKLSDRQNRSVNNKKDTKRKKNKKLTKSVSQKVSENAKKIDEE